ncbi:MAG: anion transporter [Deltaproteobacteria bacterium]|nr:anion transporter [Deltaproteobacteria bacterium]
MPIAQIFVLVTIAGTLAGVAFGRCPGLQMNRATIVLVGATVLLLLGAISLEEAYRAVDMNTIVLLFSMMALNINLRLAGFFKLVSARIILLAKTPRQLLAFIVAASGFLSALFLNDTIALMFTPIVLEVTKSLKRNPVPYLIGLATAANVGSAATIVGNPQNMLIGMASEIPFVTFAAYLIPPSLAGMIIVWLILTMLYRSEFANGPLTVECPLPLNYFKPLLVKSLIATALMLGAFVAGAPIPLAALGAASLLLVTRRLKPQRVFREIDWSLLVFFAGLFVVTRSIGTSGLGDRVFSTAMPLVDDGIVPLAILSAAMSNIVSNVPAVLLFSPVIENAVKAVPSWITLAMATTFAGNLTLLGSVANLIVAESAKQGGVELSFKEYLKAGIPITIITLFAGIFWLKWLFG